MLGEKTNMKKILKNLGKCKKSTAILMAIFMCLNTIIVFASEMQLQLAGVKSQISRITFEGEYRMG